MGGDGSGGVGLPSVGDVGEGNGLIPFPRRRPELRAAIAARVRVRRVQATARRTSSWFNGPKLEAEMARRGQAEKLEWSRGKRTYRQRWRPWRSRVPAGVRGAVRRLGAKVANERHGRWDLEAQLRV